MVVVMLVAPLPLFLLLVALLFLLLLLRLEFRRYLKVMINIGMMTTLLLCKQIKPIRHLKIGFSMAETTIIILTAFLVMASIQDQIIAKTALAQTTTPTTSKSTTSSFSMNGAISSLVLGMSPKSKTVDMTTVDKFILSGDWSMSVDKGKIANF